MTMESTLIPFIPSNLVPLLQIDLLVLEQARRKNAAQHRSALFFRRVHEVYRLGKEIYRELGWTNAWLSEEKERRKGEAFRIQHELEEEGHEDKQREANSDAYEHIQRLRTLLEKIFPALTKASDSVAKMIHHLHFLPLTTLLQACYARLWVISTTIYGHVRPRPADEGSSTTTATVGYADVIRFAHPMGGRDASNLFDGGLDAARSELDDRTRSGIQMGKGKSKDGSVTADDEDMEGAQVKLVPMADGEDEAELRDFGTKVERKEFVGDRKMTSVIERRIRKKSPVTSFSQPASRASTPVGDHVIPILATPGDSRSPSVDVQGRPRKPQEDIASIAGQPGKLSKKRKQTDLFATLEPKKSPSDSLGYIQREKQQKSVGTSEIDASLLFSRQATEPTVDKPKPLQGDAQANLKRKKKKKKNDIDDIFGF